MRNARELWGFDGYVTSDSDSVQNAYAKGNGHGYPAPDPTPQKAVALALTSGQCDINSGDTYNNNLLAAVANTTVASECVIWGSVRFLILLLLFS
jgi:beta-glucosidase-like glycosyl hydrolase